MMLKRRRKSNLMTWPGDSVLWGVVRWLIWSFCDRVTVAVTAVRPWCFGEWRSETRANLCLGLQLVYAYGVTVFCSRGFFWSICSALSLFCFLVYFVFFLYHRIDVLYPLLCCPNRNVILLLIHRARSIYCSTFLTYKSIS